MGAVFKLYYVAETQTLEGEKYLKFHEMKVNNEELVFFSGFPFTVIHKIDESVFARSIFTHFLLESSLQVSIFSLGRRSYCFT